MAQLLLDKIRTGAELSVKERFLLTMQLSAPAIMAQISSIVMQFIDASMVGHIGADAAASIGLMATSTWLFGGLMSSAAAGFSVQVAHNFGAGKKDAAREVFRQALTANLIFSFFLLTVGASLAFPLPRWLGGDASITENATIYFLVFALFFPMLQLNYLAGSVLRCSGNMKVPSFLNVMMCVLDVIFNFFLIFPTRNIDIFGVGITMPGCGLGVLGAALGTGFAEVVAGSIMLWFAIMKSDDLRLIGRKGRFIPTRSCIKKALRIGVPMGCERTMFSGAQIFITAIVAPLGNYAIAANAFAITAESLCYMPGYGIADAATTLVGQSIGAGRKALTKSFARLCVYSGIAIMTILAVAMYAFAPYIMELMTPVEGIQQLGTMCLRTEAFAEPMFAASIVAYGVFVGAGDTLIPAIMNLGSIWGVRIALAALLAPTLGLQGVWIAMCVELCFRGIIFLIRMRHGNWTRKNMAEEK